MKPSIRFSLCAVFLCLAPLSFAQPAQIIIVRHAEKTADPNNRHLSEIGRQRAQALVQFVRSQTPALFLELPVALYATARQEKGTGQRCQETVQPLSKALNLPLQTAFKVKLLAKEVLEKPQHRGRCVLICWTHQRTPGLIEALGIHPPPPKLEENNYDTF